MLPIEEVLELNMGLAYAITHKFHKSNGSIEYDDIFSRAFYGLYKACKTYDESTGFQLSTLAYKVMTHEILRLIAITNRADDGHLSLDLALNAFEDIFIIDILIDRKSNTEKNYVDRESLKDMFIELNKATPKMMKQAVYLKHIVGYTVAEVAVHLGISRTYVNHLIHKFKNICEKYK